MKTRNGNDVVPNEKVLAAMKVILNEVNAIGNDRKTAVTAAIYETVSQEHRTIQQSFWSAMLMAQIEYAGNSSDLRNELAVKLANKVKEMAIQNNFDMGLPTI